MPQATKAIQPPKTAPSAVVEIPANALYLELQKAYPEFIHKFNKMVHHLVTLGGANYTGFAAKGKIGEMFGTTNTQEANALFQTMSQNFRKGI